MHFTNSPVLLIIGTTLVALATALHLAGWHRVLWTRGSSGMPPSSFGPVSIEKDGTRAETQVAIKSTVEPHAGGPTRPAGDASSTQVARGSSTNSSHTGSIVTAVSTQDSGDNPSAELPIGTPDPRGDLRVATPPPTEAPKGQSAPNAPTLSAHIFEGHYFRITGLRLPPVPKSPPPDPKSPGSTS
jgi:hypothetical protein